MFLILFVTSAIQPSNVFSQDQSKIDSLKSLVDDTLVKFNTAIDEANNNIPKLQIVEQCNNCGSDTKLSALVLSFGLLTIVGLLGAMLIRKKFFGPNFTKIIGVTVILTFALLLPTLNISGDLETALVGLIGTLGGYLFGKSDDYDSKDDKETEAEKRAREARERGEIDGSPIG